MNNIYNGNIDNLVAKTIFVKSRLLRQNTSITKSNILQNSLQLSKNFDQIASRIDEYFSFFIYKKLSPGILPSCNDMCI